jgi:hypothetical protein
MSIAEVIGAFGTPEHQVSGEVAKERVLEWTRSADIDVLGLLYGYVSNPSYSTRVAPPLSAAEFVTFMLRYFERCFKENPESKFADSRYEAGWDLVGNFIGLWRAESTARDECTRIKAWLAEQYRVGDEEVRRCIVDATLEHLFENREIADYFGDWRQQQSLKRAYDEAMEWSAKGGRSPLGSPGT